MFIDNREILVENVFGGEDTMDVYVPVNFKRIINNIQNQLNYQSNSMVNITPLDAYIMIDKTFGELENIIVAKPTLLFKLLYYYSLSPKNILIGRMKITDKDSHYTTYQAYDEITTCAYYHSKNNFLSLCDKYGYNIRNINDNFYLNKKI